jgi:translation elongation factor EF-4
MRSAKIIDIKTSDTMGCGHPCGLVASLNAQVAQLQQENKMVCDFNINLIKKARRMEAQIERLESTRSELDKAHDIYKELTCNKMQ